MLAAEAVSSTRDGSNSSECESGVRRGQGGLNRAERRLCRAREPLAEQVAQARWRARRGGQVSSQREEASGDDAIGAVDR